MVPLKQGSRDVMGMRGCARRYKGRVGVYCGTPTWNTYQEDGA